MIGRRGKVLLLLYVVFLAILFLMCSTDWIIREPEKEVYQIAVIVEDARDDNYVNFRKGMDQAAMELSADVHFITLYEEMDADQQMELINREQQDGADALVIVPVDEDRVAGALAGGGLTVPAVLIGSELTGEGTAGTIAADYKKMGGQLAGAMMEDMHGNCQVLVLEDPQKRDGRSRRFLEGATEAMDGQGCRWESAVRQGDGQGFAPAIESLWIQEGVQVAIFAETPEVLVEAAGLLAENQGLLAGADKEGLGKPEGMGGPPLGGRGPVLGLYGRGSMLSILNYLDRGVITGICAMDDFSVGYLSVDMAVGALEGGGSQRRVEMDSSYIEKEDLRRPEYEKLLYPVE